MWGEGDLAAAVAAEGGAAALAAVGAEAAVGARAAAAAVAAVVLDPPVRALRLRVCVCVHARVRA